MLTLQEDEDEEEEDSDGNESDDREQPAATGVGGTAPSNPATGSGATATAPASGGATNANSASNADEFVSLTDEQIFERRGGNSVPRGNLAPSSMQWAIRTREPPTIRSSTTTGLVFIDHASGTMRRSAASTAVAAAAAAAANAPEPVTMATTASGLARAFGIIMR
jgi:hypothetical protein